MDGKIDEKWLKSESQMQIEIRFVSKYLRFEVALFVDVCFSYMQILFLPSSQQFLVSVYFEYDCHELDK